MLKNKMVAPINQIIALTTFSVAIFLAVLIVILYYTLDHENSGHIVTVTPSQSPSPPEPTPQNTILAPSYKYVTEFQDLTPCPTPIPEPTNTPSNENYPYPLNVGRFAASMKQGSIVALGNQEGKQIIWCRKVYFLVLTSNGFEEDAGSPIIFDETSDYDFIGWANDKFRMMAIENKLVPTFAFITAINTSTNTGTVLVFERLAGTWQQVYLIEQNPAPLPGIPFGNTIVQHGNLLYVSATTTGNVGSVQTFKYTSSGQEFIQELVGEEPSFGQTIAVTDKFLYVGSLSDNIVRVYQKQDDLYTFVLSLTRPASQTFGVSIFASQDDLKILIADSNLNTFGVVYVYERSSITGNLNENPVQIINYPTQTGYGTSQVEFGTTITGFRDDAAMIAISATQLVDDTSNLNKISIYRYDTILNTYVVNSLEPQNIGQNILFGEFMDLQQLSTAQGRLLVGDPQNGTIEVLDSMLS